MQAAKPSAAIVDEVVRRLAADEPPTDSELANLLDTPKITTGLDHWALWTLICLRRHLDRQHWVGYMVESRLKGDLRKIGCAGAFGHPEELPQSGDIPGEPDWKYYLHGCGCCLTNKKTGESIDVDFTREGACDLVDPFFYSSYLASISNPAFPESLIRRNEPLEDSWQVEIDCLEAAACIEVEHSSSLTSTGLQIADALAPLWKQIPELLEWGTNSSLRKATYSSLSVGDVVLAHQCLSRTDAGGNLTKAVADRCTQAKNKRKSFLEASLRREVFHAHGYVAALASLGPEHSQSFITDLMFQNPVDGAANTALEILRAWNLPDLPRVLEKLLKRRYAEATGLGAVRNSLRKWVTKKDDRQPRNYQITKAATALFQRVRWDSLDKDVRERIRFLLESAGGAQAGVAALLLHLVGNGQGLHCLRRALSCSIPAAREEAAAACVIIGTNETKRILNEALQNSDKEIQHMAACALAAFPAADAVQTARQWFTRNDGIKEPLGTEVTVLGRTAPVFTFEEVSHANMDGFFKCSLEKLRQEFEPILKL